MSPCCPRAAGAAVPDITQRQTMTPKTPRASNEEQAALCYPLTGHPENSPISFHAATPEALQTIAACLCAADRDELEALGHSDLHAVIRASVDASREAYVACWDGEPQAVFGVADYPQDSRYGVPWLLSTGTGDKHAHAFMSASRRMIAAWSPMYLGLFNLVSPDHLAARIWLEALGFVPMKEHAINGHVFTEYGYLCHV